MNKSDNIIIYNISKSFKKNLYIALHYSKIYIDVATVDSVTEIPEMSHQLRYPNIALYLVKYLTISESDTIRWDRGTSESLPWKLVSLICVCLRSFSLRAATFIRNRNR